MSKKQEPQTITLYRLTGFTDILHFSEVECRVCPKTYVSKDGRQYPKSESSLANRCDLYVSANAAIAGQAKRYQHNVDLHRYLADREQEKLNRLYAAKIRYDTETK